jgi:hypothetical protein
LCELDNSILPFIELSIDIVINSPLCPHLSSDLPFISSIGAPKQLELHNLLGIIARQEQVRDIMHLAISNSSLHKPAMLKVRLNAATHRGNQCAGSSGPHGSS